MQWTMLGLAATAAVFAVYVGAHLLVETPPAPEADTAPILESSAVVEAPDGHAYQYIAAPNASWETARAAAQKREHRGRRGYLATIDTRTEYQFIIDRLFPITYPDVTYLGGRQTAPGEWRWVTGPDGLEEDGKGRLFWQGYAQGRAPAGRYATWMPTAFQRGGTWDVSKVCCVTLFSYGVPQFSTSLGNAGEQEGIAGYLVEFGG